MDALAGPSRSPPPLLHASRHAALVVPWRVRLAFPEPLLQRAVACLGEDGIPLRGI
jgi:hypothetical protein